jgi:hypothetical protein
MAGRTGLIGRTYHRQESALTAVGRDRVFACMPCSASGGYDALVAPILRYILATPVLLAYSDLWLHISFCSSHCNTSGVNLPYARRLEMFILLVSNGVYMGHGFLQPCAAQAGFRRTWN